MKTLGGRKKQLLQALWAEYLCLGALAGFVAAFVATLVAWAIAHFVLKMPFQWHFQMWFVGMLGGAIGISVFGVLGNTPALRRPPLAVLRKVGANV